MSALRPLLVLGVILTAAGLASEQLGPIVGPVEYNGYLVFDYPEGDNPITNIVFEISEWISPSIIIVDVPSPWTYTFSEPTLTLTGGSLNPGGSVSVVVSLDDYFDEGKYSVSSVGTTSAGEVSNAEGPLLVGDLYLLRVISLANTYQTPLIGSVIGLIALELMFWQRNRPFRNMIPPVKEVNDFVRESQTILNKDGKRIIKVPENKEDPDLGHKSVISELGEYNGSVPIDRSKHNSPDNSPLPEESKMTTLEPDSTNTLEDQPNDFDNSDLPGLEDTTDSDNSDRPELEKPEAEPTEKAWDSDLPDWIDNPPEIEPSPEPTEADLKELEEIRAREKKLPRLDPDEKVSG